ncbi:MAG: hypothetical protein P4L57_13275 [Rhizomicrobium sp.]|nr:hypothetical protein [Rhizomicrobium sp.]
MRLAKLLFALAGFSMVTAGSIWAEEACAGLPPEARTTLPDPLAKWGSLVCTPYGQILSNHQGWIWSYPGAFAPVFIPSQMVRDNPEPLGNKSYFTSIQWTKVEGEEFQRAYSVFQTGFAPAKKNPVGYRLDVRSVSGRELELYFFDSDTYAWGIWCPEHKCDAASRFMILDMSKKPS